MIEGFGIQELVPPSVHEIRGDKAWQLLDYRALATLEWLRKHLGTCTVNNWVWGGSFEQSGLRTYEVYLQESSFQDKTKSISEAYKRIAKSLSQHKYGRAFDCKFQNYTAEEVRKWIKGNWGHLGFPWAITLEEGVNWLHFDVRNWTDNLVHTFKQ